MGKILGLIYDSGVPLSSFCISMAVLSLGWFKIFKSKTNFIERVRCSYSETIFKPNLVLITTITLLLHPYIKPPEPLPEGFSVINYSFLGYSLGRTPEYNPDLTSQSDIIDGDTQEDPAIEQDSESAPLIEKNEDEQTLIQARFQCIYGSIWLCSIAYVA